MPDGRDEGAASDGESTPPAVRGVPWRRHSWLPLVLPVDARVFWTRDAALAATLVAAGGAIARTGAEFELVTDPRVSLEGEASSVVRSRHATARESPSVVVRRADRVTQGARLAVGSAVDARRLRRLGYHGIERISWDEDAAGPLPTGSASSLRRKLARRFPRNVAVMGHSTVPRPSGVFATALERAASESGAPFAMNALLVRDTCVVAVGESHVIRVGLGAEGGGTRPHADALDRLRELRPNPSVLERLPRVGARGALGMGYWALESRLGGTAPHAEDVTVDETCLSFVLDLARVWTGPVDVGALRAAEETVTPWLGSASTDGRAVVDQIVGLSASLRGTVAHGDFFHGNLLCRSSRLVGVLDWERFAHGRPAGLDLVHRRIAARAWSARTSYGSAAVELAGAVRSGRVDPLLAAYSSALDLPLDRRGVVAVVATCWLLHVAHELERIADNGADEAWVAENLRLPAVHLAPLLALSD